MVIRLLRVFAVGDDDEGERVLVLRNSHPYKMFALQMNVEGTRHTVGQDAVKRILILA